MEEKDQTFTEWFNSLTVTDVVNNFILIIFVLFIIILVIRTFRNKPSA